MLEHERNVRIGDGRIVRTAAFGPRDGAPVIWHHGNPGSRIAPFPEAVLERAGVRLITYDRPGGGASDPLPGRRVASCSGDIAAIADAWGLARFGTAGFSGGGSFALATAALLGDRVGAAAVLSGAAPIDAEGLDFKAGMTDRGFPPSDDELRSGRATFLADMEPSRQAILADPQQALRGFVEAWPASDHEALRNPDISWSLSEGMAECVRVSAQGWLDDGIAFYRPWGFDVRTIVVPVSIWHGCDDTAAPITHARWLARRISRCDLHELEGAHYAAYVVISPVLNWLVSRTA